MVELGFEGVTEGVNEGISEGVNRTLSGFVLGRTTVFIDFLDFRGIEKRVNLTVKGA